MYYEKWGFMLIFWNLAGVPLSYCHCTIFLANHEPSVYSHSWPVLIWFYTSYLFAYWVWDTGNSQKNMFRAQERGYEMNRKTFPQLPWKAVKNPQKIETNTGNALLCDGWYKYARKVRSIRPWSNRTFADDDRFTTLATCTLRSAGASSLDSTAPSPGSILLSLPS